MFMVCPEYYPPLSPSPVEQLLREALAAQVQSNSQPQHNWGNLRPGASAWRSMLIMVGVERGDDDGESSLRIHLQTVWMQKSHNNSVVKKFRMVECSQLKLEHTWEDTVTAKVLISTRKILNKHSYLARQHIFQIRDCSRQFVGSGPDQAARSAYAHHIASQRNYRPTVSGNIVKSWWGDTDSVTEVSICQSHYLTTQL